MTQRSTRRQFLKAGVGIGASVTGCLRLGGDGEDTPTDQGLGLGTPTDDSSNDGDSQGNAEGTISESDGDRENDGTETPKSKSQGGTPIEGWPMYQHDSGNTGYSDFSGPQDFDELWRFNTDDKIGTSSPIISDGAVYIGTQSRRLYALDASTGNKAWEFSANGVISNTPAASEGTVYIVSGNVGIGQYGVLHAIDTTNGNERWSKSEVPTGSVTIAGDTLFMGGQARDGTTGALKWEFKPASVRTRVIPPAVSGPRVFAISGRGIRNRAPDQEYLREVVRESLHTLDRARGSELRQIDLSRFETYGQNTALVPVVTTGATTKSDALFFGVNIFEWKDYARNDYWTRVRERDHINHRNKSRIIGSINDNLWESEVDERITTSIAVSDDTLYVGTEGETSYLYALDAFSGDVLWRYSTGQPIRTSPAISESTVYFASGNRVFAIDANEGTFSSSFELETTTTSSPALDGGVLYIADQAGTIYALGG